MSVGTALIDCDGCILVMSGPYTDDWFEIGQDGWRRSVDEVDVADRDFTHIATPQPTGGPDAE